jgi:hypothetical protein
MRYKKFSAGTMKITVFWDVIPCTLVMFKDVSGYPEDGGSTIL